MTASCRPCESNFHDHCKDVDPGTPCACQCPGEAALKLQAARRRVSYHRLALRQAEAEVAALLGGYPVPAPAAPPTEPDPGDLLAKYRRPEDRRLGHFRLELATKEMYGT